MATFKRFEEIEAWQVARELAKELDELILSGIFGNRYRLIGQIEGAVGSMMDCIAEGLGRGGRNEFILFLGYAKGSAEELKSQLYRTLDNKSISQEKFNDFYLRSDKFAKMVSNLISYLNHSEIKGERYKNRTNPKPQTLNPKP